MATFWNASLEATMTAISRVIDPTFASPHIKAWLASYDEMAPTSSASGAHELPFQRWMKFKEAFSPKFVVDALTSLETPPRRCVDPFGGSGTTALTCSLLGVQAVTIEVNPFLADLIDAKVTPMNALELVNSFEKVLDCADDVRIDAWRMLRGAPASLREPGVNERFVFWAEAIDRILALRSGIEALASPPARRLLKVLLGSTLVEASNVVVNGKGRRYRGGWQGRRVGAQDVDQLFEDAVRRAARDIAEYGGCLRAPVRVLRGDSRKLLSKAGKFDVAVFSPPYPNSFDYTDVYNLELWVLGYLADASANRRLRQATLRSHVQVQWEKDAGAYPAVSATLARTIEQLIAAKDRLWDPRLVGMLRAYFQDMAGILCDLRRTLHAGGRIIMVVGDSCYAGVRVDTTTILREIGTQLGFAVLEETPIRSMRSSAQHGGRYDLSESCLVLATERLEARAP